MGLFSVAAAATCAQYPVRGRATDRRWEGTWEPSRAEVSNLSQGPTDEPGPGAEGSRSGVEPMRANTGGHGPSGPGVHRAPRGSGTWLGEGQLRATSR